MRIPDKHRKKAAWMATCVSLVGGAEGIRTVAYLDPVGIPTVCFGETRGVRMGDKYTVDQCKDMLGERLEQFGGYVDSCVTVALPPNRKAGLVSFTYNVGEAAFCSSTLVKKLNAGDIVGACEQLPKWNKATYLGIKITLPGLTTRRGEEKQLCLSELPA